MRLRSLSIVVIFLFLPLMSLSQKMTDSRATIRYISSDIPVSDLSHHLWKRSAEIAVTSNWNGTKAPKERQMKVRMLWSDSALYVRFDAEQNEPLVVSEKPELTKKTMKLWDRDVCELFLAPDARNRRRYFEFEIAPTGEWLDVMLDWMKDEPRNWDYASGMETFARIESGKVTIAMKIPWGAFGAMPKAGDVWLGNLFRCVGRDPNRGYLAWRPTMTEKPNFHVPERFGEFVFES